jgi:MFS family permease
MRRLYALAGFGGLANGAFSTYCVVTLVAAGWSPPAAGLLFAVSGALGVVSRVVAGYVTDRSKVSPMAVASPMLFGGALGALALAFHTPLLAALGAFAGYALGWGAPGLVQFAIATMFPRNVGSATGKVWLWSGLGVSAGPLLFYQVSEHAGSEWSWFGVAGSWAVSAFAARACAKFAGGP